MGEQHQEEEPYNEGDAEALMFSLDILIKGIEFSKERVDLDAVTIAKIPSLEKDVGGEWKVTGMKDLSEEPVSKRDSLKILASKLTSVLDHLTPEQKIEATGLLMQAEIHLVDDQAKPKKEKQ